jgi:hypothetical protein
MKLVFFTVSGFLTTLICLTVASPYGYLALAFVYAALLYHLFFGNSQSATWFLLGFTLGTELLSTHRFGAASVVSLIFYGVYVVFALRLRFTSPYARFIVAMLISLLAFAVILYPLPGLGLRLIGLSVIALIIGTAGALAQRVAERSHHGIV